MNLALSFRPIALVTLAALALSAMLPAAIAAPEGARYVVIGGQPLDGPRFMWWNFVSSRRERIDQAKRDWEEERFPAIAGETERIPLPPG